MQSNNRVIIASAGSGKTTKIVRESIESNKKILILTYTNDNLQEIKKKFIEVNGIIPFNINIMSWFSFLLREAVRPYQACIYDRKRISNIDFVNGQSTRYVKKTDVEKYYLKNGENIYTDKMSEFVTICNSKTKGAVIKRLSEIYDYIYIDEVQDLAGYDLDIIELLLKSDMKITLVGDIRQATYTTNNSTKNKKYLGVNIIDLFKFYEKKQLCSIIFQNESYRCNQEICNLADSLYPKLPATVSKNTTITNHDGLFIVNNKNVQDYIKIFSPKILRYDKRTSFDSKNILNFGQSKGLTFDRILIITNLKFEKYLITGDISNIAKSKAKVYVALTRARYSVAFLCDKEVKLDSFKKWNVE
ncbi:MAG: UvrD-helicase domain-containing protein [Clostridium perfringens]|nr:UvrD-helicase domain-containing protein [Clostridium perfringens]MDU6689878.1 UvrD-helicase domain-containing protein [Clostridium perfringens]